jgi:hypothetical protein
MDQDDIVIFQMMAIMASNTNDLFNSHEMGKRTGGSQFVDSIVGVWDVLDTYCKQLENKQGLEHQNLSKCVIEVTRK